MRSFERVCRRAKKKRIYLQLSRGSASSSPKTRSSKAAASGPASAAATASLAFSASRSRAEFLFCTFLVALTSLPRLPLPIKKKISQEKKIKSIMDVLKGQEFFKKIVLVFEFLFLLHFLMSLHSLVSPPVTEEERKAFESLPDLGDCLQVVTKNSQTVAVYLREKPDAKDSEDSKDRAKRFVCRVIYIYICLRVIILALVIGLAPLIHTYTHIHTYAHTTGQHPVGDLRGVLQQRRRLGAST